MCSFNSISSSNRCDATDGSASHPYRWVVGRFRRNRRDVFCIAPRVWQHATCLHALLVTTVLACAMGLPASAEDPAPAPASAPVHFEALILPEVQIDLSSPAEGIVTGVLVKEGARVSKNDPLVQLNSDEEKIRLQNAELQARQLAEDLQAIKRLYQENAASRDDFNRANLQARQSVAERDLLAIRLRERTISSPTDGNVLRVFKHPGESVQRLEKVAQVIALDRKYLTGFLDDSLLGTVKPGMRAEIRVPRPAPTTMEGVVEVVDPILDPGGQVFRVKIFVNDPEGLLTVGTRVPVELHRE